MESYLSQVDYVIVMEQGCIVDIGSVGDLLTGPSKASVFLKRNIADTSLEDALQREQDLDSSIGMIQSGDTLF